MTDVPAIGYGRYGDAALWILAVLADGPASAAQLHAGIRRRHRSVGPGTLFGAIARLEASGLIGRLGPSGPLDGRRSHVYRALIYRDTRDE